MFRLTFRFLTLLLLLLTCCVNVVFSASSCSLKIGDVGIIELSNIDIPGSGYTVAGTDANWNFYFNICGSITNPSTAVCTVDAQGYQYSKQYNLCFPIGVKGVPQISLNSTSDGLVVKVVHAGIPATDGVSRALSISLTCDLTAPERPTLTFSGESREGGVINYGFSGKSKLACPYAKKTVEWGRVMEINVDFANLTFPELKSVYGQPNLVLKLNPIQQRNVLFYIGNCLVNEWNSIESVKEDHFYQNYGCISLIAQELNSNEAVQSVWQFSNSNQEMVAIVQSNLTQQVISNRNPDYSFTISPPSAVYNLFYAKKISFNYTKFEIGQTYSIQSDNSAPFTATFTTQPQTYFEIRIENTATIQDVYIGKKPITWNIERNQFFNYDYHLNLTQKETIYSGEATQYYLVSSKGGFKVTITEHAFRNDSNRCVGGSLLIIALIFSLLYFV
ncbi:hypothetical protein NAEGRDRAFT_78226 [Naegleria gruberi]|uniref:MRH domain-containing protein n=1 Tax=Naegleria gruberi TaxID=5762 RepID=D2V1B8_NAEGR|nr:uncharacterized protein NAEGRDRAFT_78226 [Naegleria gruberi]EFC49444.1 hypothetical protein NAEGRDRAFT_78226 [Naegleria gruberi]|eukprot:XP_002682188.1 hypothetical protein NAEGRDRAFT_78226 [Naegleria gruberi strain NEG-M]